MAINLIAREGNFVWSSESIDSGPYYVGWTLLMSRVRSFGTRGLLSVRKPGGIGQKESFRQSKAAFACCRYFAQVLCCGMSVPPDRGVMVVEMASKAARAEYGRWSHQFGAYVGTDDGYVQATIDRFEIAIKEVVALEAA